MQIPAGLQALAVVCFWWEGSLGTGRAMMQGLGQQQSSTVAAPDTL
jgi:hypothetical protein